MILSQVPQICGISWALWPVLLGIAKAVIEDLTNYEHDPFLNCLNS